MKIGLLVPSTTNNRSWENIQETYLYTIFLKSFLNTYCHEHVYTIYVGIDDDDRIYSNIDERKTIERFIYIMKNVSIEFVYMKGIKKGWVANMWSHLMMKAYDDNCDYFYQCGDDVEFLEKGWVSECIKVLQEHNDIGLTGPLDKGRLKAGVHSQPGGTRFIQTQAFVSKKHKEIFDFFFPPEIANWYCDDWITHVYYPKYFYIIKDKYIVNKGGQPRYDIIGSLNPDCHIKKKEASLSKLHYKQLLKYLSQ